MLKPVAGMLRVSAVLSFSLMVSACGCMLEEGDSMDVSNYWNGCWAEAKGN